MRPAELNQKLILIFIGKRFLDNNNNNSKTAIMAVYEVYSQSVSFKYKSTLCSKSTIFSVVTTIFSVIFPFLLAYRSHGFWLRISSYREQPLVNFKHQYLLVVETEKSDSSILCSSLQLSREFDRCIMIKSREEDSNTDGYYDKLVMDVEVEVPANLSVYSVQLVLIFDYTLQKRCLLQMEGAVFIQFNSGFSIRKLEISGDLKLVQKRLLKSDIRDTEYNKSVFHLYDNDPTAVSSIQEAMKEYVKRDVNTGFQNGYQMWTRGPLLDEPFILSLNILYPEETVYYVPNFWETMKWAWMQYLAFVIIFFYISRLIKEYVFANRLVSTYKEVPWKTRD